MFQILAYTELTADNGDEISWPEFDDYGRHEVLNHVKLCEEAGFIDTYTTDGKKRVNLRVGNSHHLQNISHYNR